MCDGEGSDGSVSQIPAALGGAVPEPLFGEPTLAEIWSRVSACMNLPVFQDKCCNLMLMVLLIGFYDKKPQTQTYTMANLHIYKTIFVVL